MRLVCGKCNCEMTVMYGYFSTRPCIGYALDVNTRLEMQIIVGKYVFNT